MNVKEIAKVCHEVNRAYCQVLGDLSQKSWDEAPDWQRDSAINGVEFHLKNPDAGPENSHNSWLAEKADAGWVFGPEKSEAKKTHPCMVSFHDLPVEQQAKDYIFRGIVHALKD